MPQETVCNSAMTPVPPRRRGQAAVPCAGIAGGRGADKNVSGQRQRKAAIVAPAYSPGEPRSALRPDKPAARSRLRLRCRGFPRPAPLYCFSLRVHSRRGNRVLRCASTGPGEILAKRSAASSLAPAGHTRLPLWSRPLRLRLPREAGNSRLPKVDPHLPAEGHQSP